MAKPKDKVNWRNAMALNTNKSFFFICTSSIAHECNIIKKDQFFPYFQI